jgi:diaminohydroxyphosphoribosylaminopyrimidine deaminase/5-amino-6-(5-phosphoribosylamino)uracil reductase
MTARDQAYMRIALMLASRGLGTTAPNPAVGAVVVDPVRDVVLARGWTAPGGRPHAEPIALARAGAAARGATLYVTLEPCSHHGRTPPCADAIVAAGIARVVVGIEDPDPRVAGRGLDRLAAAGIAVERYVLAEAADRMTRGHILRVTERRPFVQVKIAVDADGELPRGHAGQPAWVTGPLARAVGHRLRAEADAILVGRRTVTDDDPDLTCRLPGTEGHSPVRVVLATRLDVSPAARLLATSAAVPVWIFAGPHPPPDRQAALREAGGEVLTVRELDGGLWLPAVLESLVARGITRLLVEGGPQIWHAFDRTGFVDEVVLFEGGAGDAPRQDPLAVAARYLPRFRGIIRDIRPVGPDRMTTLSRQPTPRRVGRAS